MQIQTDETALPSWNSRLTDTVQYSKKVPRKAVNLINENMIITIVTLGLFAAVLIAKIATAPAETEGEQWLD